MKSAWLEQLGRDLRFAVRSLGRARLFTLTVLGTLVIGIGSTTVIFDLTSWIILRDLPYPHPEQLYYMGFTGPDGDKSYYQASLYYRDYREQTSSFGAFAACFHPADNVDLAGQPRGERVDEFRTPCFP